MLAAFLGYVAGPIVSYLVGAVPFCLLLGKWLAHVDIRQSGSGNTGAANLARVTTFPLGLAGLSLDFLKGFLPVYVAKEFTGGWEPAKLAMILCGLGAICGHVWPVYLGFRGGKGLATAFGVAAGLAPAATGIALFVWLVVLAASRYISLSSMTAAVAFAVSVGLIYRGTLRENLPLFLFSLVVAAVILVRHRSNLARLLAGRESKIGARPRAESRDPGPDA